MPANVTEFDGMCYAVAYRLHGGRLVPLGTRRADHSGVRGWLAAGGHAPSGWRLVPAAGTPPGFYAKPYLADAYYRLDPPTGVFAPVGASLFDDRPGDERGGAGGAADGTRPWRRVVRYTAIGILFVGGVIGTFAAVTAAVGERALSAGPAVLLAAALGAAAAGAAALRFGGPGYTATGPAFARF